MTYSHYERLSAMDATFLDLEDASSHMHIGSVGIFDAGPVSLEGGGLDMERMLGLSDVALQKNARFRQKIARIPRLESPVWVDDERFNLSYHVRHTALPAPGDERQLKRLAGRIMSQQLDRGKPLWEMWFVEALEGDRFAVISKIHHCLADGVSGVDLLSGLMGPDPEHVARAPARWIPRPAPPPRRMLIDEVTRRASAPLSLLRGREKLPGGLGDAARGLGETLSAGMSQASPTPLNDDLGPHRRFDWTSIELDAVKQVRKRLGGTLNDVVLAVVAGSVRTFLRARAMRVEELDFRTLVPVSVRTQDEHGRLGNRVSTLMARLPLDEADPAKRLARVIETTGELKGGKQALGGEALAKVADLVFPEFMTLYARMATRGLAANMVVTNVPGPRVPIYMSGARMLEVFPVVPLAAKQGLGVALFSYAERLFWGFNADWDAVPDLHDFVDAIGDEFEKLHALAADAPVRISEREAG
jgi:WS/DGAT/MGAT family acyltransferase